MNASDEEPLEWLGEWDPARDAIIDLARGPAGSGRAFEAVRAGIAAGRFVIDAERLPESCEGLSADELIERARQLGIPDLAALVERGPKRGFDAVAEALPNAGPAVRDRAWAVMSRWALFHARRPYVEHVMPTLLLGYEELRGAGVFGTTLRCWVAGLRSLETIFGDEHANVSDVDSLLGVPPGWFQRFLRHFVQFAVASLATELAPDPEDLAAALVRLLDRFGGDERSELGQVLALATGRLMLRVPAAQAEAPELLVRASSAIRDSETARGAWLGAVRRDVETNVRALEALGDLFVDLERRDSARTALWPMLRTELRARLARFESAPLATGTAAQGIAGAFAELVRARSRAGEPPHATVLRELLRAWNTLTLDVGTAHETHIDEQLRSLHVDDVWIAFADVAPSAKTGELVVLVETSTLDAAISARPEDAWSRFP